MLCTSLRVPGVYSPVHTRVQVCQALPSLALRSRFLEQCKSLLSHPGQCTCCFTPQQALALPCKRHWLRWAELPPRYPLWDLAWPLPWPHPCTPSLLPCGDHGNAWVPPTRPPQLPLPNPLPGTLLPVDETMQVGTSWLLRGIWTSVSPKSGSLWLAHAHSLGAGKERVQGRLQEPGWGRVTATAGDSVPSTFPAGAIRLINQMSMAGMGGKSLGMESGAQGTSLQAGTTAGPYPSSASQDPVSLAQGETSGRRP